MSELTPTQRNILHEAEILFANKGFYGTSLKSIADELSVTKQGILHYYPSKEKLYAAVLETAARYLMQFVEEATGHADNPAEQLLAFFDNFASAEARLFRVSRLFVRELLDNVERAEQARQWFLAPLLAKMEALIIAGQEAGLFAPVHPMAFIYQMLGTQQYFLVSLPTLRQIHDPQAYQAHIQNHLIETKRILTQTLFL